jgi:hypothetical protein
MSHFRSGFAAVCIVLLTLFVFAVPAFAQDAAPISYGEIVAGMITDETLGTNFTFEAAAGDIVVVQLMPGQDNGAFANVRILSPNNQVIADSSAFIIFGRSGEMIAAAPTAAGTYTINAFGATGSFNLLLLQAVLLTEEAVTGTVAPRAGVDQPYYGGAYAVISSEAFTVEYALTGGAYRPSLVYSVVRDGGVLFPSASVINVGQPDEPTAWTGGGLTVQGSRNINIFLVGDLETFFGSSDASLAPAEYSISLSSTGE